MEMEMEMDKILQGLRSSDNITRSQAETWIQSTLISHPNQLILSLVTVITTTTPTSTEDTTSIIQSILLIKTSLNSIWDSLDSFTTTTLMQSLLSTLTTPTSSTLRNSLSTLIAFIHSHLAQRATPWLQLTPTLNHLLLSPNQLDRYSAFNIFSISPAAIPNHLPLIQGLRDPVSSVKLIALKATVEYFTTIVQDDQLSAHADLVLPMLEILPFLSTQPQPLAQISQNNLAKALEYFIDLTTDRPKLISTLLKPHLSDLLNFCLKVAAPTNKFSWSKAFVTGNDVVCWTYQVRSPSIELLLTLSESSPSIIRSHPTFLPKLLQTLLELMTERPSNLSIWLLEKNFNDSSINDDEEETGMTSIAESGVDRLSLAVGEATFQVWVIVLIEGGYLNSENWERRYAGISSFAAVAEGCSESFGGDKESTWALNQLLPLLSDPHPQVVYSTIYALGQLSVDLCPLLQRSKFSFPLLTSFTSLLLSPSTQTPIKIKGYVCAGLVNFFGGIEDVDLGPQEEEGKKSEVVRGVVGAILGVVRDGGWVVGQALQAVGAVAECMGEEFEQFYSEIMPLLLVGLEKPINKITGVEEDEEEEEDLRAKALDCVTSIATSVPLSTFAPDAPRLLTLLHNLYLQSPTSPSRSLLASYARLSSILPPKEFKPYLQDVFTHLLTISARKPDLVITTEGSEEEEDEEWETVELNGNRVAIRTEALEEKYEALGNLVVVVQSVGVELGWDQLNAVAGVGLPLLKFYFHVGVRENAAALVNVTVKSLANLPEITLEQRSSILRTVTEAFTESIAADKDAYVLATFIESWTSCFEALPGVLEIDTRDKLIKALEAQLTTLSRRLESSKSVSGGGRGIGDDDDDDEEEEGVSAWEEEEEGEALLSDQILFSSLNKVLHALLKEFGATLPLQPFVPFFSLINSSKGRLDGVHFAMRFGCDLIQFLGEGSLEWVSKGTFLTTVLNLVLDLDPLTRKIASFIVGVAAESAPNVYADFAVAAIEPLFNSIGPIDLEDPVTLAARDNSVSALGRIIKYLGDRIDTNALLPRWVGSLPVFEDADEMTPVYTLLLELIVRGHPSVSPTSDVAQHIVKVLVSALENEVLPPSLHRPIAQGLKTYLGTVPGGELIEIPPHVQAKAAALLA